MIVKSKGDMLENGWEKLVDEGLGYSVFCVA